MSTSDLMNLSGYPSPSFCHLYCTTGRSISKASSCLGHQAVGNEIAVLALKLVLSLPDIWKSPSLLGVLPFREYMVDPAPVTAESVSFDAWLWPA